MIQKQQLHLTLTHALVQLKVTKSIVSNNCLLHIYCVLDAIPGLYRYTKSMSINRSSQNTVNVYLNIKTFSLLLSLSRDSCSRFRHKWCYQETDQRCQCRIGSLYIFFIDMFMFICYQQYVTMVDSIYIIMLTSIQKSKNKIKFCCVSFSFTISKWTLLKESNVN